MWLAALAFGLRLIGAITWAEKLEAWYQGEEAGELKKQNVDLEATSKDARDARETEDKVKAMPDDGIDAFLRSLRHNGGKTGADT